MSWFNNDNVGQQSNLPTKVVRFRVPQGESKEFTFLDSFEVELTVNGEKLTAPSPIRLSEYRVTVPKNLIDTLPPQQRNSAQILLDRLGFKAGGWSNFTTVPSDGPDPLRDHERPSSIVVFSVIDHSSWTSPQGKTYVDQKRLFVAKRNSSAWGILQRQIERLRDKKGFDSLRGCRFESSRHGDKTPAVGNSFDFIERVEDFDSLEQPFDYGEILAPKDSDDLAKLLEYIHGDFSQQPEDQADSWGNGNASGGWGNASGGSDIPF